MPQDEYDDAPDVVIVKHEGVFGIVLEFGAHVSKVLYCIDGLMFEELMENDDFEPVEVDD